jgi:hypothetical protein
MMEDPRKLRELGGWYREFAERAGNAAICHARLTTEEDLQREAGLGDRYLHRGNQRDPNCRQRRSGSPVTAA